MICATNAGSKITVRTINVAARTKTRSCVGSSGRRTGWAGPTEVVFEVGVGWVAGWGGGGGGGVGAAAEIIA
jgi:hypothetical protein